jgi:D-amino peptidase
MEGLCGVVNFKEVDNANQLYQWTRKELIREVDAAINALREKNITDIVVNDSHGEMINIFPEELPDNVILIRGSNKPLGMMEGIDRSFDAVIFIGYHSGGGNIKGVLSHTYSSRYIKRCWIDNNIINEAIINALVAGYFDVPVIFISGDDQVIYETKKFIRNIEYVIVKRAISRTSAENIHPNVIEEKIKDGIKRAISKVKKIKPIKIKFPAKLVIQFISFQIAESVLLLKEAKRIDSDIVSFSVKNPLDILRIIDLVYLIGKGT